MEINTQPKHWRRTVAPRQMVTHELTSRLLVQQRHRQRTLRHPSGKVRHAQDVRLGRLGGVTTTPQVRDKRIQVWRQCAVKEPRLGRDRKRSNEVHDGLQ